MILELELPEQLQSELTDEAVQLDLTLSDYALLLLMKRRAAVLASVPQIQTGSELVNYWTQNGLIGTRDDEDVASIRSYSRETRNSLAERMRIVS